VLSSGVEVLPASIRAAGAWAAIVAAILTLAEHLLPERFRRWVPSSLGMGLACLLPASTALGFFLGGLAMAVAQRVRPSIAEGRVLPLCAGFIAGEGLVGVVIAAVRSVW
jgi:uncharacterized oligopeptide transporter (OPT) family protein